MARRSASPYRTKPRFKMLPSREPVTPARNHSYQPDYASPPAPHTRAEVIALRIDRLDLSYWLHIACGCGKRSFYPLRLLIMRHGRNATLAEVIDRLRCKTCHGRPKTVHLGENAHREFLGGPPPGWSILLHPAER